MYTDYTEHPSVQKCMLHIRSNIRTQRFHCMEYVQMYMHLVHTYADFAYRFESFHLWDGDVQVFSPPQQLLESGGEDGRVGGGQSTPNLPLEATHFQQFLLIKQEILPIMLTQQKCPLSWPLTSPSSSTHLNSLRIATLLSLSLSPSMFLTCKVPASGILQGSDST